MEKEIKEKIEKLVRTYGYRCRDNLARLDQLERDIEEYYSDYDMEELYKIRDDLEFLNVIVKSGLIKTETTINEELQKSELSKWEEKVIKEWIKSESDRERHQLELLAMAEFAEKICNQEKHDCYNCPLNYHFNCCDKKNLIWKIAHTK